MQRVILSFLLILISNGAMRAQSLLDPLPARTATPPVTLVSPADGATVIAGTLRLVWNAVPSVTTYQLQLSSDAFESVDATIPVLDTTISISDLAENKRYWWRVLADAFEDRGPFSDPRSFYLQGLSGVAGQGDGETVRGIEIAPDPSSVLASIGFHLTASGTVSLEVFDQLGRVVTASLNERLEAGDHRLPIDVAALADGIYFYRLTTSAAQTNGKLVVRH